MASSWEVLTTFSRSLQALTEQMLNMAAAAEWLHMIVDFKKLLEQVERDIRDAIASRHAEVTQFLCDMLCLAGMASVVAPASTGAAPEGHGQKRKGHFSGSRHHGPLGRGVMG